MKMFKRILSVFLSAAIMVGVMCTGGVSASAAENEFEITAKYNPNKTGPWENMNDFSVTLWGPLGEYAYRAFNENDGDSFAFSIMLFKEKPESAYLVPDYSYNRDDRFYLVVSMDKDNSEAFYAGSVFSNKMGMMMKDDILQSGTNIKENSVCFTTSVQDTYIKDVTEFKYAVVSFRSSKNKKHTDFYSEIIKVSWKKDAKEESYVKNNIFKTSHTSLLNYKPSSSESTSTSSSSEKDISSLSFSKISNKAYTGKAIKPSVTVKDGDTKLKKGTDYTVSYKNNKNIGTASVTIKGKGNYTGSKTIDFKIVPAKTTLKAKKQSDTKIKLTWDKVTNAEKYQIYYSTNGGSYKKLATVSGSKTSYTNSKLDFKKNDYKFKIRAYDKVDGTTYYGSYSKAVTVK